MIEPKELREIACVSLGEDVCHEIAEWYQKTIHCEARYVIYVVRRCYMLALIMEHITGIKMKDSEEREFLTEASFFLRCNELAEYYRRYKRFPKILLCDDILIHGRNINHFLKIMEEQLCQLLPEYEESEIQIALVAAIEIYVYVRSEKPLLLLGRYELSLEYERKEPTFFWRRVSSNVSSLILRADMANACYICSESIPKNIYQEIENSNKGCKTVFQNTTEYTFVSYLKENNFLKAISTIRVIKTQRTENYRVVPFVFLPNLDGKETEGIKQAIFNCLREDNRWERIEEYIDYLSEINGKRLFNEWLTLLISRVFLNAFNKEYWIEGDIEEQDYIDERTKLIRNYNAYGEDITKEIIEFTLTQNVLTKEVVCQILQHYINEHYIMNLDGFEKEKENIDETFIRNVLENYFYENAIIEETSAFELSQISYVPTKRRSMRRVRGCGFTIAALNEGYTKTELNYSMAYFLQMMDAGVLSISSYASKDTKVVGFAQFAKAGEQSLQIYPLRLYEYIPLLIRVYRRCILNKLELKKELINFFASKYCQIEKEKQQAILQLVEYMVSVGQTPYDWSGNYLMKVDLPVEEGKKTLMESLLQYIGKQETHINNYEKYTEG